MDLQDKPGPLPEDVLSREDLVSLVQTSGELASRIDLADLLQEILSTAGELTNSPDGAVLLHNRERNSLYFAGAIGEHAPMLMERYGELAEEQVPLKSKAGVVFLTGSSIIVNSVETDPEHFKGIDRETHHPTETMVCVPLSAAGETLGAMQLLNKPSGSYTRRDQVLLEQFANHAAIAIRNARLIEDLLAHMGLFTSREFSGGTNELLAQLRSKARTENLTVMFADMRGFRHLCQAINNPEKILEISNRFITMLAEQGLRHRGVINKFLGDGILVLFRHGDHAQRAVNCAFAMVDEFAGLKEAWRKQTSVQVSFLDLGVGITTGEVIIGTIGIGKVRDFTALGTPVNLAAAFEKEARGGKQILVDQLTYSAVEDTVAEIEQLKDYELRQPDQRAGILYPMFHLKRLRRAMSHKVFISHSKEDREFVEKQLINMLSEKGIDRWYSENDISGGASWVLSITEALDSCDWFLVVISQSSAKSDWVKEEVEMAGSRPHLRSRMIPLRLDDTELKAVHPFLAHKQAIDAQGETFVARLIDTIQSKDPSLAKEGKPGLPL